MASAGHIPPGLEQAIKAKGHGKPVTLGPPAPEASAAEIAASGDTAWQLGFGAHGRSRRTLVQLKRPR